MRKPHLFLLSAILLGHLSVAGTPLDGSPPDDLDINDSEAIEEVRVDGEYPGVCAKGRCPGLCAAI
jgi:hypothetical protein